MQSNKYYRIIGLLCILVLFTLSCSLPILGSDDAATSQGNDGGATGSGQGSSAPPPWLNFGSECQPMTTNTASGGTPWKLDAQANPLEVLPKNQTSCFLQVQICGDIIAKTKIINVEAGESCPATLHFSYAPQVQVCCAAWQAAKSSKIPCDPLDDIDCDGKSNQIDDYMLDPQK